MQAIQNIQRQLSQLSAGLNVSDRDASHEVRIIGATLNRLIAIVSTLADLVEAMEP